jgi:hypothetical protein
LNELLGGAYRICPLDICFTIGVDGKTEILCFAVSQDGLSLSPFLLAGAAKRSAFRVAARPQYKFSRLHLEFSSLGHVKACGQDVIDEETVVAPTT